MEPPKLSVETHQVLEVLIKSICQSLISLESITDPVVRATLFLDKLTFIINGLFELALQVGDYSTATRSLILMVQPQIRTEMKRLLEWIHQNPRSGTAETSGYPGGLGSSDPHVDLNYGCSGCSGC
jgi:hypothetical protein